MDASVAALRAALEAAQALPPAPPAPPAPPVPSSQAGAGPTGPPAASTGDLPRISTATALSLLAHLITTGCLPQLTPTIARDALYTPDGVTAAVAAAATAACRAGVADLAAAVSVDAGAVAAAVPAALAASRGTLLPGRGGDVLSAAAIADAVADAATAVDGAADGEATVATLAAAANVPAADLDDAPTAGLAAGGGHLGGAGGTYRLAGGVLTSGARAGRHAAAACGALRGVATPTGLRAVAAAARVPPRTVTAAAAAAAERGEGRLGGEGVWVPIAWTAARVAAAAAAYAAAGYVALAELPEGGGGAAAGVGGGLVRGVRVTATRNVKFGGGSGSLSSISPFTFGLVQILNNT